MNTKVNAYLFMKQIEKKIKDDVTEDILNIVGRDKGYKVLVYSHYDSLSFDVKLKDSNNEDSFFYSHNDFIENTLFDEEIVDNIKKMFEYIEINLDELPVVE